MCLVAQQQWETMLSILRKPYTQSSRTGDLLRGVPDLDQEKITIAIYDFPDRTGQRKPNDRFSQLSTQ